VRNSEERKKLEKLIASHATSDIIRNVARYLELRLASVLPKLLTATGDELLSFQGEARELSNLLKKFRPGTDPQFSLASSVL